MLKWQYHRKISLIAKSHITRCHLRCDTWTSRAVGSELLLSTFTRYESIFLLFYCQGKYHSASRSESLKPPGAIYRFMCIHLHRWTQPWTRPEMDGCAALIRSGRCDQSPVYYGINSQARLHNWGRERAAGMQADKKCARWIRSSYIHTSLALMSLICLPLLLPLAALHRFTTAAAMLGYINLQPDRAAQSLMSERSRISRTTRWGKRDRHRRLSVRLRNHISGN